MGRPRAAASLPSAEPQGRRGLVAPLAWKHGVAPKLLEDQLDRIIDLLLAVEGLAERTQWLAVISSHRLHHSFAVFQLGCSGMFHSSDAGSGYTAGCHHTSLLFSQFLHLIQR